MDLLLKVDQISMHKEYFTKTCDLGVLPGANGGEQEKFWKVGWKRIGTNIIHGGIFLFTPRLGVQGFSPLNYVQQSIIDFRQQQQQSTMMTVALLLF
jgi:hypothetical protein